MSDRLPHGLFPGWAPGPARPPRKGHAAIPGTGPEGETCGTCDHLVRRRLAKTYLKCGLIQWTSGAATDIRAKDPACSRWEPMKRSEP
ncbi:hypothetical protein [Shumkonia mesophila]|uniref:hypothetical protein n=1 Tax=Shumkonia mesophila TaxID=2838854 RepID=UPI0029351463|nr:hypothetical protein [Shumkonia mesophila]